MISRRKFVGFLSAVPLVGSALSSEQQLNQLLRASESTEKAWTRFTNDLADALADLDEDEHLIIEKKKGWHYVQFAAGGKFGMRAEAVSNGYLDDNHRLSEEACTRLLNLGWDAPTHIPDDPKTKHPDGSPNYFVDVGVPVPYGAMATLAVNTLRGVFGVGHPGGLRYKAFANGSVDIRFPRLRIARER